MNISTDFKPILTKAAFALQNKSNTEFKALVFREPKAHSISDDNNITPTTSRMMSKSLKESHRGNNDNEFNIKKARHEILNFAMNNQRVQKNRKKMQMYQLVQLGAKPAKKTYKNYKDLLDERKRLKEIREDRRKFHQLGKNQTGSAAVKCQAKHKKHSKKRAPVTSIDQHYGVAKPKLKKKK